MKIFEVTENISHTSKRLRDIEQERDVKIGSDEWFKLWFSLPYLKKNLKETIYDILEPEDCGPFDGGCVLVAQALQKIHGGEIVVLINDRGNADHAAVKIGNTLLDYDGPLPVEKFIKRFEKNEHVKVTGIRPMEPGDLPEATRNQSLLPEIINLLSKGKSKNVKEASGKESSGHSYLLQLERDNRAGMLVLHILDQKTGKRTEVRGKLGYETNGYDPEDKLHQILDKVGKSASVSDLMNGDVVSINPRHPQGPAALKVAHDITNEERSEAEMADDESRNLYGQPWSKFKELAQKLNGKIINIDGTQYKLKFETFGWGHFALFADDIANREPYVLDPFTMTLYSLDDIRHERPLNNKKTQNVKESNPFTDARMNAIKAGKTEFTVGGKTYKVTGDTSDEEEAVANISESLDQPYPYSWYIRSEDNWAARARTDSGGILEVWLEYSDWDALWDVEFLLDGGYKATAEGDQFRIFATVVKAIKEWWKSTSEEGLPVKTIRFSADKLNKQTGKTGSRERLYSRFAQQFANSIGFTVQSRDDTNATEFELINPNYSKGKVNEAVESGKEMLKIFRGMHHDAGMNKDMDRYIQSHDWQLGDFTPDMFPSEEEFFDYDDPFDRIIDIDYSHRVNLSAPIIVGPQYSDGKYSVIDGNHRAATAQRMGKTIQAYFPVVKTNENFADGKNPGRKGLAKRSGVNTKASVSSLRKTAKNSSGEKQRMAHWLANMKAGKDK